MRVGAVILGSMLILCTGCHYLRGPMMPYRSGMGPLTWERYQRVMKFQTEIQDITEVKVTGGGYDIHLEGPDAERAMHMLLSSQHMAEPTEPVHVFVRCLAIHGLPEMRTLDFGFDPRLARGERPSSKFTDFLSDLQKVDRHTAPDSRLSKTFSLLSNGFDRGTTSIQAIDVAVGPDCKRHLTSQRDIAMLLGDFAGIRCQSTDGAPSKGDIKIAVSYTESGKLKSLNETFGTNEEVIRHDLGEAHLSMAKLAAKLKQAQVPSWENLFVIPTKAARFHPAPTFGT